MSAKTTGCDVSEASANHEFYNLGGSFLSDVAPYIADPKKTSVTYKASVSRGKAGKDSLKFVRTKMLPSSAIERANKDQKFNYDLVHSVAFNYKDEILGLDDFICEQCGQPAATIAQAPTVEWDEGKILDIQAQPCCDEEDCIAKTKNQFMAFASFLDVALKRLQEKSGRSDGHGHDTAEEAAARPGFGSRACGHCGEFGDSLLRCSRCKESYYCNIDHQKKAWKKHKKHCRPPQATEEQGGR